MEQITKEAILSWLSKTLHTDIHTPQGLRNGEILVQLCNKIPGINIKTDHKFQGWKDSYLRLKSVHQQIQSYMKNSIQYQFPNAISHMNIVEMAKGEDDQGLMCLLNLICLVCFNLGSENSQIFIEKVIMLPEKYQQQLMDIIQNNQIPKYEAGQMQEFEQKYQRERQKVKQMISAIQNLTMQNDSLRDTLISQAQQSKKLSELLKKSQQQKQKFKKQLLQTYKNKQEQDPSKKVIVQHHEQMIQLLKADFIQQDKNYSQQIFELKQKIQSLEQELDIFKNKTNQLQEKNIKGLVDHSNCINIQSYKKEKNQLTAKLTEASSKQWKTKLQNIKLQNLIEELKQKNKKISEESKNKQNNVTCTKNQANRLRLQFYTQIRDKLKQKIQNNPMLSGQGRKKQSQQNIRDIILDDPEIN